MRKIRNKNSDFRYIRENNLRYVDKTEYIYRLLKNQSSFYFISRPDGFGKSLFCSALYEALADNRELFEGLYIAEKTSYRFDKHPVIHLDFRMLQMQSKEVFITSFQTLIENAAADNDIEIRMENPSMMIDKLIRGIYQKEGKGVAVIIDDYDSPFFDMLPSSSHEFMEWVGDMLDAFYEKLEVLNPMICFMFVAGVARFSLTLLDTLSDISMEPFMAEAFGYTESEIMTYFSKEIGDYLSEHPEDDAEHFIRKVMNYYGGYRFQYKLDSSVCNPESAGSFFRQGCEFPLYSRTSGSTRPIIETYGRSDIPEIIRKKDLELPVSVFSTFDAAELYEYPMNRTLQHMLMYYLGYLAIAREEDGIVTLDIPNKETRAWFL